MSGSLEKIRQAHLPAAPPAGRVVGSAVSGRWEVGESLSPQRPVPEQTPGGTGVSAIQADVARLIGAALLQRFDWTRPVVLEQEAFQRLAQILARRSSSPAHRLPRLGSEGGAVERPHWSLRVGGDGASVELALHEAGKVRSLGTVLKKGPHTDGARIFRPDPSDNLQFMWAEMAEAYNGAPRAMGRVMLPKGAVPDGARALDGIDPQGRVIVLGHGDPGGRWRAATVGGLTARRVAEQLLDQGLPKDFAGTVYLHSCSSGSGLGRMQAFSCQLQKALAAKGLRGVTVAGRPGVTQGSVGQSRVAPSEVVLGGAGLVRRTDRLVVNLEREQRHWSAVAAKALDGGQVKEAEEASRAADIHGRLAGQERAYRDRIAGIGQAAALAQTMSRIESIGLPAELGRKPPLHRRLLNGLRGLLSWRRSADRLEIERRAEHAFDGETFRAAGVRNMWGIFGPRR
ncbi:hypothetical protein [Roseateles sp. L2-2]|uniref:hypothetical protein n=1 Tax=Roseateles sp. L2-2 TaxID=3422597 RepID=UPI003D366D0F